MAKGIQLIGCGNDSGLLWNTMNNLGKDLREARGY
jgi:hypothetical protein